MSLLWHNNLTVLDCACLWGAPAHFFHLLSPHSIISGTCSTILKIKQPENIQVKRLFLLTNKYPFPSWVPVSQTAAGTGVQILCSLLAGLCWPALPSSPWTPGLRPCLGQRQYSHHSGYRVQQVLPVAGVTGKCHCQLCLCKHYLNVNLNKKGDEDQEEEPLAYLLK